MSDLIPFLLHPLKEIKKNTFTVFYPIVFSVLLVITFSSCSSVKFTGKENESSIPDNTSTASAMPVRLLINDNFNEIDFIAEASIKITDGQKSLALVNKGNRINIRKEGSTVSLRVGEQSFTSSIFILSPANEGDKLTFNGKRYRGNVIAYSTNKIVNMIAIEEYLKGVLPAEMPLGKGTENFEALKAFAICARTYTMMKLKEGKPDFDLFTDVRDQVYGGTDAEKELSNKAVEETAGMILQYSGEPAVMFYSASCGGYSEEGGNVFVSARNKPYLSVIKDGEEPFCSITPRFQWREAYTVLEFVKRFIKAGLIPETANKINSLEIKSRFKSGRVNELELSAASDNGNVKPVSIFGNQIRSIIRTADNKGILRSTMFDIDVSFDSVIIKGKGYGHGVGLCQWGAIAQSRQGINYKAILEHYFPGTKIESIKE